MLGGLEVLGGKVKNSVESGNPRTHLQFATNFLQPKFAINPDASLSMGQVQIHPLKD